LHKARSQQRSDPAAYKSAQLGARGWLVSKRKKQARSPSPLHAKDLSSMLSLTGSENSPNLWQSCNRRARLAAKRLTENSLHLDFLKRKLGIQLLPTPNSVRFFVRLLGRRHEETPTVDVFI